MQTLQMKIYSVYVSMEENRNLKVAHRERAKLAKTIRIRRLNNNTDGKEQNKNVQQRPRPVTGEPKKYDDFVENYYVYVNFCTADAPNSF